MALLFTQDSSYGTWSKTGLERGLSKPLEGTFNGEVIDLNGRTAVLFQDIINSGKCTALLCYTPLCSTLHSIFYWVDCFFQAESTKYLNYAFFFINKKILTWILAQNCLMSVWLLQYSWILTTLFFNGKDIQLFLVNVWDFWFINH